VKSSYRWPGRGPATDAHGTPLASVHNTNWTNTVVRIRTDPFGAGRPGQTGTVSGHGFLGAPADPTGLTLLGARFYDPDTGSFVSADPVLDPTVPAQFNAYVYAGHNPVTWADPSGLSWMTRMQTDTRHSSTAGFKCDTRQVGCQLQAAVGNQEIADAWTQTAQEQKEASASVHSVLSALGLVPEAGELFAGIDAMMYLAEGEFVGAGLGVASMIPFAGWGATVGKFGRLGTKTADTAATTGKAVPDGVVYRRTDLLGGKPYIGQAKNEARFTAQQAEHARANPDSDFEFEIIGRANPGAQLDRLEEFFIRQGGGPTNRRNPNGGLANLRHQMGDPRYLGAGGDPW